MRKDVECTFGILKGHFRILKSGITIHGIEATDQIWMTCCALHNFLLEEDGLDDRWDMNKYMESLGHHDDHDIRRFLETCNGRVSQTQRQFDTSDMGAGSDVQRNCSTNAESQESDGVPEPNPNGAIKVQTLSLPYFRQKLIQNFDILWETNRIQWPSRTGLGSRPDINAPDMNTNF